MVSSNLAMVSSNLAMVSSNLTMVSNNLTQVFLIIVQLSNNTVYNPTTVLQPSFFLIILCTTVSNNPMYNCI